MKAIVRIVWETTLDVDPNDYVEPDGEPPSLEELRRAVEADESGTLFDLTMEQACPSVSIMAIE